MNHRYAIVRNALHQTACVAPETARQRSGKGSVSAIGAASVLLVGAWLGGSDGAWAATGSCAGTSPVTVSTAVVGTCALEDNDELTVEVGGSIAGGLNHAITVEPGTAATSITNRGSLAADFVGIHLLTSSVSSVSNSGTVLSGAVGLLLRESATVLTVDNSGTLQANNYGVHNYFNSTITTLRNSGTIETYGFGVFNQRNSTITTLDNSGTILSMEPAGAGVYNEMDSTIGTLENSGTIEGGSLGVYNHTNSTITTLDNTGTIEGGAYGVYNLDSSTITTLNNTGTIQGPTYSVFNDSNSMLTTLNNSGSLIGRVQTQNTTINLSGTSARIVGDVVNDGGSVHLLSGASFTPEGSFTTATFTVHSGATLRVPQGGVASIRGSYTQDGTLRVGASSATNHGRVSVNGSAVITPQPPSWWM